MDLGREPSVDEADSTEIIEAKEEKPQENAAAQDKTCESVVEELITPIVAQEEEKEPELDALPTHEVSQNEPERKSPAALDEIISANLGDQTLMTPAKSAQPAVTETLEDVVEELIADTLDQIKSDDLLNQSDAKSENNDSG